ncbi:hypothetical protein CEUSTIGMA_g6754.t1 [Chlamydomonas eustigma]|uniref:Sulfhydryl oxidase n=1 Tax=Chlamydomonas eustigma TaxID=1157962 RepID=A0A250X8A9_9CHLO|nr:hypothetical protein CEUSTIGMA_g6754.t1 [Chlamydomonas eustigma]|eukprot:GAX79313.1 hypothetical protein CEUSTIGMA_g6754.t1 [Chlamydomonas eustigma]
MQGHDIIRAQENNVKVLFEVVRNIANVLHFRDAGDENASPENGPNTLAEITTHQIFLRVSPDGGTRDHRQQQGDNNCCILSKAGPLTLRHIPSFVMSHPLQLSQGPQFSNAGIQSELCFWKLTGIARPSSFCTALEPIPTIIQGQAEQIWGNFVAGWQERLIDLSRMTTARPIGRSLPFASVSAPLPESLSLAHAKYNEMAVTALGEDMIELSAQNRRAELGRATWTLLHTLAAQLPDHPTRQQQSDTRQLIDVLTRIYPCGECATHFKDIVRRNPPTVHSGPEFRTWLCHVHNIVNRSLGKPSFNCNLLVARWAPLNCSESEETGSSGSVNGCAMSSGKSASRKWEDN